MKPETLQTKIFLDSGDPAETKRIIDLLGFLDGQTTNPSLVAKTLQGQQLSREELLNEYRRIVSDISVLIPNGSVSIEVYADESTSTEVMLEQAREMFQWIPNAHIKFPTTLAGLAAAEIFLGEGGRVNMTLVFSQEQAAAVYAASRGSSRGAVFLSPFIGRLDDRGENGMDLIQNILTMYERGDGHVEVLVASVRNLTHFLRSIQLNADIITAPFSILQQWVETGMKLPAPNIIPYQDIPLEKNWRDYDIAHELTTAGLQRFAADWNALLRS